MKTYVLAALAVVMTSGAAMAYPSHKPTLTASERLAIARSQHALSALEWRVRADGKVTPWERMQIRAAQARHNALVYRLTHN